MDLQVLRGDASMVESSLNVSSELIAEPGNAKTAKEIIERCWPG
jgi:hypothetical protein